MASDSFNMKTEFRIRVYKQRPLFSLERCHHDLVYSVRQIVEVTNATIITVAARCLQRVGCYYGGECVLR